MKTHHPRTALACFLALTNLFAVLPRGAQAAPPDLMTYQGFLVDGNGNPLATNTPANYRVTFRIYSTAVPANPETSLWSEQQVVTVDKGNFSVQLMQGTAVAGEARGSISDVFTSANSVDRYLELSVELDPQGSPVRLLPRLRLLPAPYAFLSKRANGLVTDSGTDLVTASGTTLSVAGTISGNGSLLTGLNVNQLAGVLNTTQIPDLPANKITGTLLAAQIPRFLGTHAFTGNVGIGLGQGVSPSSRLEVIGSAQFSGPIFLGSFGERVPAGFENLRILRGVVRSTTASQNIGSLNFTVTTFANGIARVTVNPAFTDTPAVTVTVEGATEPFTVTVKNVLPGSFEVNTWRRDTTPWTIPFHFTAIGGR